MRGRFSLGVACVMPGALRELFDRDVRDGMVEMRYDMRLYAGRPAP
jgi:hypothetical protein